MKYLILGVNGMAGHIIAQYLKEQGHTVTGFARECSPICDTVIGNARNEQEVITALYSDSYDYVINCIGVLNKFVDANLADGIYLNSVFPHFVAKQLEGTNAKLIHISTDCVFEGTEGKYTEKDAPDATSYYGRSKALGEVVDEKNLTIRTSIIGPELKSNGIGLFHWFMSQKDKVYGYEKVIWSGVTTLQLAKAIEQDITTPQTGLYHLVNNEDIPKHDLLVLFNKYCRANSIEISANDTLENDKTLRNTRAHQPFTVPTYEVMIQEMAEWMKGHPALYQQYKGV